MENNSRPAVQFLTINEFKNKIGKSSAEAQVVKSPITGKLFLAVEELRFKVQADISQDKPMAVLVPEEGLEQACLVNTKPSTDNVIFTI